MDKFELAIENYSKAIKSSSSRNDQWWFWHLRLGEAYKHRGEYVKALPYLKKGLGREQDDYSNIKYQLGHYYLYIGDYSKALKYLNESLHGTVGCQVAWQIRRCPQVQGKFQEALNFTDSICEVENCELTCNRAYFELYTLFGEFEIAEKYFYRWQEMGHWLAAMIYVNYQIGYVYDRLGKKIEAKKTFEEQIEVIQSEINIGDTQGKRGHLHSARIYAYLGEKEKAFKNLIKYANAGFHWGWHDYILIDPFFESLRNDPEFLAIVRKAQDEKAAIRAQIKEMEERGELDL